MGFWKLFSTGTYAIIGTNFVESENVMKSAQKNRRKSLSQVLFCKCLFLKLPFSLYILAKFMAADAFEISPVYNKTKLVKTWAGMQSHKFKLQV